jgi:2-ketocyclohexanecarboxyl-CoA hydrolase
MVYAVKLFCETEESKGGVRAFMDKRKPEFHKYVKSASLNRTA